MIIRDRLQSRFPRPRSYRQCHGDDGVDDEVDGGWLFMTIFSTNDGSVREYEIPVPSSPTTTLVGFPPPGKFRFSWGEG